MSSASSPARGSVPGPAEFALLGAISLAWGTSYMLTKLAVVALPPFTLIAARTVLASLAMVVVAAVCGGIRMTRGDLPALALVGLASGAVPLWLIAISVSYADSSTTATAMALVPILAAFYATFRGEYPSRRTVAGLALGFGGIVVLFGPHALGAFGDSARGALAALGASGIFAGSLFLARLVRHRDTITVATVSQVVSGVVATAVAVSVDGLPAAFPSARVAGAVVVLGLVNTALANLLLFALLARAGASFTSYNNYLVPTVAVACGSLFLGEPLTPSSVAGAALVLSGVAVSTLPSTPPTAARPAREAGRP